MSAANGLRMTWAAPLLAMLAAAPVRAQTLEVIPDTGRRTVGDPVGLRLVLRQYEGDALLEQVPHPEATLGDGVRLLAVDSMRRVATRVLEAHASIAFYRPGPRTIPAFAIDFRRGAVILHGTMRSEPVPIQIVPVLAAGGGPTLRDIKEISETPGLDPRLVAGLTAGLAVTAWAFRRRGRRAPALAPALAIVDVASPPVSDAFAVALARLAAIERAGWSGPGQVARHYEAVADALRDYLETAAAIPARTRTTSEVLWSLPPHLATGELKRRHESLFEEADLVKFARRRPGGTAAAAFLGRARELLESWEAADAIR